MVKNGVVQYHGTLNDFNHYPRWTDITSSMIT